MSPEYVGHYWGRGPATAAKDAVVLADAMARHTDDPRAGLRAYDDGPDPAIAAGAGFVDNARVRKGQRPVSGCSETGPGL